MANTAGIVPILNRGSENESNDSPGRGTSRIRSRVACRGCNHRKVRCDVTRTGIPCSNCLHEAATCQVLPRKKHQPRRSRTTLQSPQPLAPHDHDNHERLGAPGPSRSSQVDPHLSHNSNDPQVERRIPHAHHDERNLASQLVTYSDGQRQSTLDNDLVSRGEYSGKSTTSIEAEEVLPDDSPLTYIGDKRGPRFFVYDLCHPESPQDAMPYLLPREADISWKPREVEYLRHQGAFIALPDEVCDDLVCCYFHHVHFFLPIVDAASFLAEYENTSRQNISLLLFWSMLLAAANFVEGDVLRKAGFASRKAMKTAFYERAKCLYDLDHGTDKLVLIQSVILMGFWYTDPQDHTGAWYWIGIAITLSQALGLHRSPQLNGRNQRFQEALQPLIRRIWWSCVVRDGWLSLAKGRPMRIHSDDCDVPLPGYTDILNNLETIPIQTRKKFIPTESEMLAKMWINLVKISATLGKILRIHYRVNGPKPTVEDVDTSAEELRNCKPQEVRMSNASGLLLLHAYHAELFYEATVAVLYRPYVLGRSALSSETQATWQKTALEQARSAASNTNAILEKIIELDSVHLLKPMIITALIPAMQIHLFDCKSSIPLRRGLGKNKLNLYMLVLSQLRNTYWSASVIYRLFERATTMLDKPKSNSDVSTQSEKGLSSHRGGTRSNSKDINTELQEQLHRRQYQQQQDDTEDSIPPMPESGLLMDEQLMPGAFWLNDSGSPCFSNVDHLLSPGFFISENTFQPFYMGYDNGNGTLGAYDQIGSASNSVPTDLVYHS